MLRGYLTQKVNMMLSTALLASCALVASLSIIDASEKVNAQYDSLNVEARYRASFERIDQNNTTNSVQHNGTSSSPVR